MLSSSVTLHIVDTSHVMTNTLNSLTTKVSVTIQTADAKADTMEVVDSFCFMSDGMYKRLMYNKVWYSGTVSCNHCTSTIHTVYDDGTLPDNPSSTIHQ